MWRIILNHNFNFVSYLYLIFINFRKGKKGIILESLSRILIFIKIATIFRVGFCLTYRMVISLIAWDDQTATCHIKNCFEITTFVVFTVHSTVLIPLLTALHLVYLALVLHVLPIWPLKFSGKLFWEFFSLHWKTIQHNPCLKLFLENHSNFELFLL